MTPEQRTYYLETEIGPLKEAMIEMHERAMLFRPPMHASLSSGSMDDTEFERCVRRLSFPDAALKPACERFLKACKDADVSWFRAAAKFPTGKLENVVEAYKNQEQGQSHVDDVDHQYLTLSQFLGELLAR
jgi:hypothetical protein